MYLTESDNIWRLYLEGAAEDMVTSVLNKQQAPDDVVQFFLQKENGKLVFKPEHVGVLYGWIKNSKANINTLKSDYQNYQKFFASTPLNQFKSYVDWTEKVHGKRDEAAYQTRHKNIDDIELEGQDKENIIENNDEILILKGDDEHKCVKYGRGYSFCISRPGGGNMYGVYRSRTASTFYFIFFKQVPKDNPKHIMVLDRTQHGWAWTFADNNTKQIKGGWNELVKHFPTLAKYKNKFVNKPMTPAESEFYIKSYDFSDRPTLEQFNTFNYQEKAHVLKHGMSLPMDVFDSLDKYLRNEWVSVGPKISQDIFDKLTPVERERCLKVRKQIIPHEGMECSVDRMIVESDLAFKQELMQSSKAVLTKALKSIRAQAAKSDTPIYVSLGIERIDAHGFPAHNPHYVKFLFNLPDLSDLNGKISTFTCNNTNLLSLKGLPEGINTLICDKNQLTSLEGIPDSVQKIGCDSNQLTSLKGLPAGVQYVGCRDNQLTSLEGLPAGVKEVCCYDNRLTSLEGLPAGVIEVLCDYNPGNFTEEDIQNAKRGIYTNHMSESLNIHKLLKSYLLTS